MAYVALFDEAALRARVGATRLKEAIDEDNDGVMDADALAAIIQDASSYVLEAYYVTFEAVPEAGHIPAGLRRLALDAAVAYLAQRAPEVFRIDWERLFKWVDREVTKLKQGERKVGAAPPDAAANHGGEALTNDPYSCDPPQIFFVNGTGIF
jgi:phage gp36-like protein